MSVLLRVHDLVVNYGHVEAVKGVNFHLNAGEITALVGANGAGKSSILLALSGLLKTNRSTGGTGGKIEFAGEDIRGLAPHEIVRRGLVQVAEGRAILTTLTVRENLELGAYTRARKDRGAVANELERVFTLFPVLKARASGLAGNLSGGEQQMLAIGRALMAAPRLLLLDEPSMGLAPLMVREIFRVIDEINRSGITVLLVEQNVRQALKLARHGYVLENGEMVLTDSGANLLGNPRVIEAYLGG
ncbi:MAG TPA: ABC transporter ATP-binding protein [Rhodocyclaceae bacterium]|jgi:branched-chain amino acid transport system ATP-binding protein|nr:ABC transporter ATP-binding protein [Rhodocyclaceae bacterium]